MSRPTHDDITLATISSELSDHGALARLLYVYLYNTDDPPPSQRALADQLGFNVSAVRPNLRALEEDGRIDRRDDPTDPRCNVYEVVWTPD